MSDLATTTELCRLMGEPTRLRFLSVLGEEALTVAELMQVTGVSQSRASAHLAKLKDAGLVRDRPAGPATFYARADESMGEDARALWQAVRARTADALFEEDAARARAIAATRNGVGAKWADTVAGQMERHYSPGRTWEATARGLLGLCDLGDVLDVASGDGVNAELVAPRAKSVTCLDVSEKVIDAGRRRLAGLKNVRFERGDMHELPFKDASFDAVLLMNALQYAKSPAQVAGEAARVLRPGGLLTLVTLKRHRHESAVRPYNHENSGFVPGQLKTLIEKAGLQVETCAVTSRETKPPHFEIISAYARRVDARGESSRRKK